MGMKDVWSIANAIFREGMLVSWVTRWPFIQQSFSELSKLHWTLNWRTFPDNKNHEVRGGESVCSYSAVVFMLCGISLSITFDFLTHVMPSSNNSWPGWHWQTYDLSVGTQICVHRLSICWQIFPASRKARFSDRKMSRSVMGNRLLSSLLSSTSPSRMSAQQSSIMSSQGEPNEKASVEHCWLVEPITKPILQASQQSWRKARKEMRN